MRNILDICHTCVEAEWIAHANLKDIEELMGRSSEARRDGLADLYFGSPSFHECSNSACDEIDDLWTAEILFSGYYDLNDPETVEYFAKRI